MVSNLILFKAKKIPTSKLFFQQHREEKKKSMSGLLGVNVFDKDQTGR